MPKKPELSATDQALRESIGSSIRFVSAAKGSKPADVASAGGVSLAHQYRIESGERTADVLYMVKVARHLGISIDQLINGRQDPLPASQTASAGGVNVGDSNSGVINTGSHSVQQNFHKEVKGDVVGRDKIVHPPSSTREKTRNEKR